MKDILYFNTLEDIKLVKMLRVQKNSIKYKTNGHTYVDLGLPSGTLWATMNVGALSETDPGLYFAWGETLGYPVQLEHTPKDDLFYVPVGREFTKDDYLYMEWTPKANDFVVTKYNKSDEKTVLDLKDDAAHVNMGGDWRMPSPAQIEELLNTDYVTNEFVENYNSSGVSGALFTSVADSTKKLFIPFNGDINLNINEFNQILIWSNTVSEEREIDANLLFGDSYGRKRLRTDQYYRYFGLGVRGVISRNKNTTANNVEYNIDSNNTKPGYVPDLGNSDNLDLGNGDTGIGGRPTPSKP